MANPIARSLYTTADMEKVISTISEPVDNFQSFRGHFGIVFKANPMVRSLYTRQNKKVVNS